MVVRKKFRVQLKNRQQKNRPSLVVPPAEEAAEPPKPGNPNLIDLIIYSDMSVCPVAEVSTPTKSASPAPPPTTEKKATLDDTRGSNYLASKVVEYRFVPHVLLPIITIIIDCIDFEIIIIIIIDFDYFVII